MHFAYIPGAHTAFYPPPVAVDERQGPGQWVDALGVVWDTGLSEALRDRNEVMLSTRADDVGVRMGGSGGSSRGAGTEGTGGRGGGLGGAGGGGGGGADRALSRRFVTGGVGVPSETRGGGGGGTTRGGGGGRVTTGMGRREVSAESDGALTFVAVPLALEGELRARLDMIGGEVVARITPAEEAGAPQGRRHGSSRGRGAC